MSDYPLLDWALSFLGGGVVATVGDWARSVRSERRQRQLDQLTAQLDGLYGPLHFLTSQNDRLFELANRVMEEHSVHFDRQWAPSAMESIENQSSAVIEVANAYVRRAAENSNKVMALLEAQWQLADHDDAEIFSRFQIDYTRRLVEAEGEHAREVPFAIRQALGNISYMQREMIQRVDYKVATKRAQVRELTCPWWARRDM